MVQVIGLWLTNTKWKFLEQDVIKLVLISQHLKDNLQSVIGRLARKLTKRFTVYLEFKIFRCFDNQPLDYWKVDDVCYQSIHNFVIKSIILEPTKAQQNRTFYAV